MRGEQRFRLPFTRRRRFPAQPEKPAPLEDAAPSPDLHALARGLGDGAPCPAGLLQGLDLLIDQRRRSTGTAGGPASPVASGLHVRRDGLPDWWTAGDNLLLGPSSGPPPELRTHLYFGAPRRAVVVVGEALVFNHINLGGSGPLVVLGDRLNFHSAAMSCTGASTVLIGEGTTATNWALVECRNGGAIVIGADGMWAHGVSVMTDDTYAIRDARTGLRLNDYGGRIVVERHVWLGEMSRVMGGARIGAHSILGLESLAQDVTLPPNSVCVGVPARPVREGVSWTREDAP